MPTGTSFVITPILLGLCVFCSGGSGNAKVAAEEKAVPKREDSEPDVNQKETKHWMTAPATIPVQLDEKTVLRIRKALAERSRTTVKLIIRDAIAPVASDRQPSLDIYVNRPKPEQKAEDPDRYFAGTVSFQPLGEVLTPQTFSSDLWETLEQLHRAGELKLEEPLRITFVPRLESASADELKVQFRGIEIVSPEKKANR